MPTPSQEIANSLANSSLTFGSAVTIVEVHDAGARDIGSEGFDPDDFVIVVDMSIPFSGDAPESARVLNAMVMDWVGANIQALDSMIREPISDFLEENYPSIDIGSILDGDQLLIWEDQVDYLVSVEKEGDILHFTIETLLDLDNS